MTPEEAKEIIKENGIKCRRLVTPDVLKVAVWALEKQIPQKLTKKWGFGVCPNCNVIVAEREQPHGLKVIPHCKWCGQALDWA